jgi:hypothetical protein
MGKIETSIEPSRPDPALPACLAPPAPQVLVLIDVDANLASRPVKKTKNVLPY